MNKQNTEKLWKEFPLLYKGRNSSIRSSLIPFGFSCSDGWYQLIYDLSSKLEPLIQKWLDENKNVRCECGCEYLQHPQQLNCRTVFKVPYKIGPNYYSYAIPKSKIKYLFKKAKYFVIRKVDQLLYVLSKVWIYKKVPCECEEYRQFHPTASQVKEKFADLRFYMTCSTDEMEELIREAENKSEKTCEECGERGVSRNNSGWYVTLCEKCATDDMGKRIPTAKEVQEYSRLKVKQ